MASATRIDHAVVGEVNLNEGRQLVAWFKYNWFSKEKRFFVANQMGEFDSDPSLDSEYDRLYRFTLNLPPLEDTRSIVKDEVNLGDALCLFDENTKIDLTQDVPHQIARTFFTASIPLFPRESHWNGGVFDKSTNSFTLKAVNGKTYKVTVEEL